MSEPENAQKPETEKSSAEAPKGDWRDGEITKLRDENASRRIEARDASAESERLKGENTKAEDAKAEAVKRADSAETSLLKLKVALSVGVPGEDASEFAELLQGADEKELTEYAEKIRKFNGSPAQSRDRAHDPTQGMGNGDAPYYTNQPAADFAQMFASLPQFKQQ